MIVVPEGPLFWEGPYYGGTVTRTPGHPSRPISDQDAGGVAVRGVGSRPPAAGAPPLLGRVQPTNQRAGRRWRDPDPSGADRSVRPPRREARAAAAAAAARTDGSRSPTAPLADSDAERPSPAGRRCRRGKRSRYRGCRGGRRWRRAPNSEGNSILIHQINIQSMKPKILELRQHLSSTRCDVILVCETWLKGSVSTAFAV